MAIETVFNLVVMLTLAIISASLILISVVGTLIKYREMKKEGMPIELNPSMLFFTMFIPIVYLSTLGFVMYIV